MTRTDSRRLKTPATIVGAGALIAMGVIGALAGGGNDGQTAIVSDGSMMTGDTTTLTFTGTIQPVVAAPSVKAKPFGEG